MISGKQRLLKSLGAAEHQPPLQTILIIFTISGSELCPFLYKEPHTESFDVFVLDAERLCATRCFVCLSSLVLLEAPSPSLAQEVLGAAGVRGRASRLCWLLVSLLLSSQRGLPTFAGCCASASELCMDVRF